MLHLSVTTAAFTPLSIGDFAALRASPARLGRVRLGHLFLERATPPVLWQKQALGGASGSLVEIGSGGGGTIVIAAANYTAHANEVIFANAAGAPVVVTLPSAAGVTKPIRVSKRDMTNNVVTVAAASGELINGAATFLLSAPYMAVTLWSDGTGWGVF